LHSIKLNLGGSKSYKILVCPGGLKNVGRYINELNLGNRVFIISSPKIFNLYGKILVKSLRKNGLAWRDIKTVKLPDGERNKNIVNWKKFMVKLSQFDKGSARKIFVVNMGGGVVSDFGGYVASQYRRGVEYVQIPTTLLACVDSGVGGKVGVDFKGIKNLVGAFHQPKLVFADPDVLRTLNLRERRSGFAEVIKHGLILKPSLFNFAERNYEKILKLDKIAIERVGR